MLATKQQQQQQQQQQQEQQQVRQHGTVFIGHDTPACFLYSYLFKMNTVCCIT